MLINKAAHRPVIMARHRQASALTRPLVINNSNNNNGVESRENVDVMKHLAFQRANSDIPAIRLLVSQYEKTRDNGVQSTLKKIDSFLSQNQEASKLPQFSKSLVYEYYLSLQPVPWLQFHSPPISFIQFILNDASSFYLDPVAKSTQLRHLGEVASSSANKFGDVELSYTLHNLLLIGLPKSHDLMLQYLDRMSACFKTSPAISTELLQLYREIGKVNRLMGTRASEEIRPIVQHMSRTVSYFLKHPHKIDLDGVSNLLSILSSRLALNTKDEIAIGRLGLIYLKQQIDKEQLSPHFFSLLFSWLSQYRGSSLSGILDSVSLTRRQLLELVFQGLSPLSKSFSDVEIAEVVSELKRAYFYPAKLRSELSARALLLCSDSFERTSDIRLLSNSFYALDHTCDPNVIEFFTDKFTDHLDSADVLLLSNIAENLQTLQKSAVPKEFRELFIQHVERLSQGIISHMTRLGRVVSYLETVPPNEVPPGFNYRFCTSLIDQLSKSQFRRLPYQMIYPYLISNFAHQTPDIMYQRLLTMIPQFKLGALEKLLHAVRNSPSVQRSPYRRPRNLYYLRLVRAKIYDRLADMVAEEQLTVGQLFRTARLLSKGYPLLPDAAHPFMLVMERLAKSLEADLTQTHAYQLADLVLCGGYHNEQLLHRLEDYVTRTNSSMDLPLFLHIIRAMSAVGYEPCDPALMSEVSSEIVLSAIEKDNINISPVLATLRAGHALSILSLYPPRLLGYIFSEKFLDEIDDLLIETAQSGSSKKRANGSTSTLHEHIRETLMRLNRAVVLEASDLHQPITPQIPWFHTHFGAVNRHSVICSREWAFKEQVKMTIEQVAEERSDYFLLTDQSTPFYHFIDFELIPVDDAVDSPRPPICVMLLSYRQFMLSSQPGRKRLRGSVKQVLRQLEILGYRVLTLSQHDWASLIENNESTLLESMRRMVFGDHND